jgi:ABC-type polysaccharide/polyol phosphate transport system ATPase subunit
MATYLALESAYVHYPVVSSSRDVSILGAVARSAAFGMFSQASKNGLRYVRGLNGVTMRLGEGTRLGIVGRNGSGKSTLLRTLAGIHHPTKGKRIVDGLLASVLSIGAGLDPEKSGRQNALNIQRLFGIPKGRAAEICLEIETFVELQHFFDLPVRTYSSGMMVRLSFAIATSLPGDILLVDEVLSAGDMHFMLKAAQRIEERAEHAKIFVMATHSKEALDQFCNHAVWMHSGRIIMDGPPADVWEAYATSDPDELLRKKPTPLILNTKMRETGEIAQG